MCVDKWILTIGVLAIGILGRAEAYTNQWAAHIDGGPRIARQVAKDHGFRYRREVIGRVRTASPTWTYAKYPSADITKSRTASRDTASLSTTGRYLSDSPESIGLSSMSEKPSRLSTTKATLNYQRLNPKAVAFTFRHFSQLSNPIGSTKLSDGAHNNRSKRLDSSDSRDNYCGYDEPEKRAIVTRDTDCRTADKVRKNPRDLDKPEQVSKDSCKLETSDCSGRERSERIPSCQEKGTKLGDPTRCPTRSETRSRIGETSGIKSSSASTSSERAKSKRNPESNVYSRSEKRSNLRITSDKASMSLKTSKSSTFLKTSKPSASLKTSRRTELLKASEHSTSPKASKPSTLLKTSEASASLKMSKPSRSSKQLRSIGDDDRSLNKTARPGQVSGTSANFPLSDIVKSHENHISYVDKMQECSAPRLRKLKSHSRENTEIQRVRDVRGGTSNTENVKRTNRTSPAARPMIIGDWYHLEHRSVKKRSTEPHLEVHRRLTGDSRVRRAEQQRAKSRPKRDLVVKRPPSMQMIFNDMRWPEMWYLNRGNGLDMNVQEAWAEGITGKGIVVTILDDGLEKDHPDLLKNYDPEASYDVNGYDDDPMPRYDPVDSNRHGTRCAGEVAATPNNSICSVGVAYGASVGGVRMLDGDVTDAVEAKSLSLYPHHIDIYSASWGPDDDGKTVDGPGELATRAFNEGVTKGRKGKGSIFVWASGNGGRDHDNCNCDGYTNSIWTLSISSATENGLVPWYSEACSSTLATTYSSGSIGEKQVVTTDLHHQCTSSHTGTSASAPLAAGICALALEANPELTWRDMQHIVVRTARPANLKAPDWVTNGVGRNVSHSFGYGLMDAAAMVRLARKWRTVPEQQKCEVSAPHSGRQIPPRSQLILELHVKECTGVNFLEHVQAKVSLAGARRGDLQIQLTSPQGTKSTLLAKRPHDISKAGFNQWPFMSVHTWGERPHGTWKLEIHNEGRYLGRAMLHKWALIFYGTSTLPDRTEYALYSPAVLSAPRRPYVKARDSAAAKNSLLTSYSPRAKGNQHKSAKLHAGLGYPLNSSSSTSTTKKSKARGQNKNGKSANRGGSLRPTSQTLRGLTPERSNNGTDTRSSSPLSRTRPRSTASPATRHTATATSATIASTTRRNERTTKASRLRISENPTVIAPYQRALVLMEPAPPKASTNRVPVVFLQYPKIQQLYPLYPVYGGARGVGPEHPSGRVKGLDLLQDQQFEMRNLQLTDKGITSESMDDTLKEWNMVFYGTDKSLEIDDDLDKDKMIPMPPEVPEIVNENRAPYGGSPNVVDSDGIAWTGSQKVDQISHPEVQRPTTENQTSGAAGACNGTRGCLECNNGWYLYEGRCVAHCPTNTYPASDEHRKVCSICHYTCASCSGASNNECSSCHADATLISAYRGDSQCVQKSLEWKAQTTVWYYRMSVIFGLNLVFLAVGCVYLCFKIVKRRNSNETGGHYDYNKLLAPEDDEEGNKANANQLLHRNGCLSDSD